MADMRITLASSRFDTSVTNCHQPLEIRTSGFLVLGCVSVSLLIFSCVFFCFFSSPPTSGSAFVNAAGRSGSVSTSAAAAASAGHNHNHNKPMKPSDMLALRSHNGGGSPGGYDGRSALSGGEHSSRRSPQMQNHLLPYQLLQHQQSHQPQSLDTQSDFGNGSSNHHHQHHSAVPSPLLQQQQQRPPSSNGGRIASNSGGNNGQQQQQQQQSAPVKNNRRLGRQESRYTSGNFTLLSMIVCDHWRIVRFISVSCVGLCYSFARWRLARSLCNISTTTTQQQHSSTSPLLLLRIYRHLYRSL